MPGIRSNHRKRALFEQGMAERSATDMARMIHQRLAILHMAEADMTCSSARRAGTEH